MPTTLTDGHDQQHLFSEALRYHQCGEFEQAERLYRETMRIDPRHSHALHLLGVVAMQQGRHDESIENIRRALELDSTSAQIHNNLAAALRARGDYEDAIVYYRRAIELDPEYARAHENLGSMLLEIGNADEAAHCFRRALQLAPELVSARENLAIAESRIPQAGDVDCTPTTKTVLHVGCGHPNPASLHERFRDNDWKELRLDIDPGVKPDIVASLVDMHPVESNSVDAVWSSHNIEHLYAHDVPIALGEFYRVLKPGGTLLVAMPDLQQVAHFIVADKLDDVAYVSPAGPITPLDCVFGFGKPIAQGNEFMAHKTGFTATSLTKRLCDAGFGIEKVWTTPFNLWGEAIKPADDQPH